MIYTKDISIPANTSALNKQSTNVKVTNGVIHQIDVYFPSGHAGLSHVQIFDGSHIIAPSTENTDFNGDDIQISGREFYEIVSAPRIITIKSWNTDELFSHTVTVRLWILPKEILLPAFATEGIIASLKSLFGRKG